MRALVWNGTNDIRCETVEDPKIEQPGDCIVKVSATAICGSDLHLMDGVVPKMEEGDILGHEFMGEVVETGANVSRVKVGDRVVVPFTISCGECWFCSRELFSMCDTTNRTPENAKAAMGHAAAGIFGYSHLTGGYAGGQAEYVRVPHADVGPVKVRDESLTDDQVLFLSDIFPTGWMAAENALVGMDGPTVAIWGCGPVGLFAARSAWMQGAGRVIMIDQVPERLELAKTYANAEVLDFSDVAIKEALDDMTEGRGPDAGIDAVGAEAHGHGFLSEVKEQAALHTPGGASDRGHVLEEMVMSVRKGGTLSVPGVYAKTVSFPIGAFMNKGQIMRTGQTHMQKYMQPLMEKVENGEIDLSTIITHTGDLDKGPDFYKTFRDKEDGCVKCVMHPADL